MLGASWGIFDYRIFSVSAQTSVCAAFFILNSAQTFLCKADNIFHAEQ